MSDKEETENVSIQQQEEPIYELTIKDNLFEQLDITPHRTGGYWNSIFFILFSTLGSGAIILPITMKEMGVIPSTLLLLLCAIVSYFTVMILVLEGFNQNKYCFSDLVKEKFGNVTLIIVDICFHTGNLLGIIVFNKISKIYIIH
jgi:hypothetical protein